MPKSANTIDTVQITISTTRTVQGHLERLVFTGLYGKNPADAAERVLARSIENMLKDGTIRT
jgi:hypothetical protein